MSVDRAIALDRLRKRLQSYRRHHDTSGPKYERTSSNIYDQQRQDTVSYHQKVVDGRLDWWLLLILILVMVVVMVLVNVVVVVDVSIHVLFSIPPE